MGMLQESRMAQWPALVWGQQLEASLEQFLAGSLVAVPVLSLDQGEQSPVRELEEA